MTLDTRTQDKLIRDVGQDVFHFGGLVILPEPQIKGGNIRSTIGVNIQAIEFSGGHSWPVKRPESKIAFVSCVRLYVIRVHPNVR